MDGLVKGNSNTPDFNFVEIVGPKIQHCLRLILLYMECPIYFVDLQICILSKLRPTHKRLNLNISDKIWTSINLLNLNM